jgi:hypothetical protein
MARMRFCRSPLFSPSAKFAIFAKPPRYTKWPRWSRYTTGALFCAVLLVGGVLAAMIEVEAKIAHLRLTFLGQPIEFGEQVLYFQSKSVLEVFQTLVTQGKPDMWIVGVLVLMFSVVFPILKILTSVFYLHKPSLVRENRVARFFVLESSKWSMADVMAFAIYSWRMSPSTG